VPLAASDVTIQPVGDADHRIIANGREINIRPDSPQAGRGGRGGAPGSLQISVASLLRAALTSSDAQREGLAGVVDLSPLTADLVCDLKADPFGTWTAEVPNLNRRGTSDRPLDISGARIVLEPVSP
jgi:hypothetical protein